MTTGGDDRHHLRAQPRPASEEMAHDDTVRPAATHSPGELAIPPKPRGKKAVSGQDRCHTLCNASHGSRGLGPWTQLNRQKKTMELLASKTLRKSKVIWCHLTQRRSQGETQNPE